ncbi:MAG TPA: STM3941 family protein [Sphingobium sp.]
MTDQTEPSLRPNATIVFVKSWYMLATMAVFGGGLMVPIFLGSVLVLAGFGLEVASLHSVKSTDFFIASVFLLGLCLAAFGLSAIYKNVRDFGKPLVKLDTSGIRIWRAVETVIPWSELQSADLWRTNGTEFLMFSVENPERYHGRVNRIFDRRLGFNLILLKGSGASVVRAIRDYPLYRGFDATHSH